MKKLLFLALFTAAAFAAWQYRTPLQPENATNHRIIGKDAVLAKIRNLNRLESSAFHIDVVIKTEKQGNWYALWQDSQKGLFIAKGSVSAGVDLAKLGAKDITVLTDTAVINLPQVEILDVQLDHIEVYDLSTGTLNLHSPDMQVLDAVQAEAKTQILQKACQGGILAHAKERSQTQIGQLFALAGIQVSVYPAVAEPECTLPAKT